MAIYARLKNNNARFISGQLCVDFVCTDDPIWDSTVPTTRSVKTTTPNYDGLGYGEGEEEEDPGVHPFNGGEGDVNIDILF